MADAVIAKEDADFEIGPLRNDPAPRAALATLGAAALAALLVPGSRAGLGLAIAALVLLAAASIDSGVRSSRGRLGMLAAAGVLLLTPLFRDAQWLVVADLLIALALAAAALARSGTWGSLAQTWLEMFPNLFAGAEAVTRIAAKRVPSSAPDLFSQFARGMLLAVGLVAVFAGLFAWADGAFAHLAGEVLPDLGGFDPEARIGTLLMAVAIGGALAVVARREFQGARESEVRRKFEPLEWGLALGALVALFAVFVAVQFVVLFGGHDHVLSTAGLTYAEYAREGFGQLVAVAALVLGVIGFALRYARTDAPGQGRLLRALLAALCTLSLIVLASALDRLDLYVDTFGATQDRVLGAVSCVWIGGLLVAAMVSLFTDRMEWMPRTVAAWTACVAIALTVANPDALIADRNVDRYAETGRFDAGYNAGLSADATPALSRLPEPLASEVLADQRDRLAAADGFLGYNVARDRARDRLAVRP